VVYDDPSEYEFEKFAHALKPDLIGSGIKEKYVFQKMGIPFRQMHSWDYSGPYHGYQGFEDLCPRRGYGSQQPDLETGQSTILTLPKHAR
jgi:nitrogenase molybdenum-iron protein alpha/beta subunit